MARTVRERHNAVLVQQFGSASTTGATPHFERADYVCSCMRPFADLVQHVNQDLEFDGQLPVDGCERTAAKRTPHFLGQGTVGIAAHRDVVIDVDRFASKAVGEETGDEQCDVTYSL